jgi:hypothetical protein
MILQTFIVHFRLATGRKVFYSPVVIFIDRFGCEPPQALSRECSFKYLGPDHKLHGQDCAQIWVRFGCGDQRKTAGVASLR